ncbi:cation diffusion facilitator family transporter [Paenibacillus sp. 598K]|uniref:cation diffusion facilitator family transporter n=1 Tax=Paenibacillus sp. 598K TaxID=1117987 RepID=UPI002738CB76|nr:cation diffusion facilitator family transporter [Paenibacillus sp. 598K]
MLDILEVPELDTYENIRQGERGAWLSIVSYIVLSALKLTIGYLFVSEALMADGLNNATDIVASIAVLIGLRISQKPPDKDHPYGHYRAETIAALIASFIMAMIGLQVLFNTVRSFFVGSHEVPGMITAWVAIGAAAIMFGVYWYNRKLAMRINSQALMAAAKDNLSDALVSIGAAVGIFGSQFGLVWLDPLAAFLVGIIICKTAWEIFYSATHALTDGFDEEKLQSLQTAVAGIKGVREIKDIKARVHGSNVLVDVIILVDPTLSLIESHRICDEVEKKMKRKHDIMNIHVHVEPFTPAVT